MMSCLCTGVTQWKFSFSARRHRSSPIPNFKFDNAQIEIQSFQSIDRIRKDWVSPYRPCCVLPSPVDKRQEHRQLMGWTTRHRWYHRSLAASWYLELLCWRRESRLRRSVSLAFATLAMPINSDPDVDRGRTTTRLGKPPWRNHIPSKD